MTELIFASRNHGKIKEIGNILTPDRFIIRSLPDFETIPEILETGLSFEENALIKAKAVYSILGKPVIADDSGLAVEQLNGSPGVHSARYAGADSNDEANNKKLLTELSRFPEPHKAKYVCCAVYLNNIETIICFGEICGQIINAGRGTNGFGYDPYFIPDGYDITMAELPAEEKNRISHRGKAFRQLRDRLFPDKKMF